MIPSKTNLTEIDESQVALAFQQMLDLCYSIVPPSAWIHSATKCEIHNQQGKWGIAYSQGNIAVFRGFLGTTAHNKLRETIAHELAHLCVGLHNNHNYRFQRVFRLFSEKVNTDSIEQEQAQVKSNIKYKWNLFAHLTNGDRVFIGGVHRKTKSFSEYRPIPAKYHSHKGLQILRYEFVEKQNKDETSNDR